MKKNRLSFTTLISLSFLLGSFLTSNVFASPPKSDKTDQGHLKKNEMKKNEKGWPHCKGPHCPRPPEKK